MTKKRFTLFAIVMAAFVLFVGCKKEKENFLPIVSQNRDSSIQQTNNFIKQYALCVAKIIENVEIRRIIKEEAMKKIDGDFDILASDLHKQELGNGIDIGELLSGLLEEYNTGNQSDYLYSILNAIPNLQVSVPVNCEEWECDSFVPHVVPVDVDFDDKNSQNITGFDANGKQYTYSLKEDPSIPVIVVSVSERIDENGNMRWEEGEEVYLAKDFDSLCVSNRDTPPFPSSLTLHHGDRREIILEWSDVVGENGYKIYRKSGGGDFILRATVSANNNGYVDQNLNYGTRYWYKVRSFNSDGVSAFSPINTTIASARRDGQQLAINRMMFNTSDDLNQVESWIRGVPELKVRVIRGLKNSSTAEYVFRSAVFSPPSRSEIVGQWWNNEIVIGNWYTDVIGTILVFDWEEEDLVTPNTVTLTGKYENKETGTFEFGGTLQFSVSDNGPIGFTSVYYWDDPFSTNQYTINGFKWSFKPAVIPIPIH